MVMPPASSASPASSAPGADPPYWQVPRLPENGRLLTGVARGIADELGVDAVWVRVAFVLIASTGWGALLYVGAWWILTAIHQSRPDNAPYRPHPKATSALNRVLAIGLITFGAVALLRVNGLAVTGRVGLPVTLVGVGVVVAWQQTGWANSSRLGVRVPIVRIAAGLVLAAAGLAVLSFANLDVQAAAVVLVVAGIVLAGLTLLIGPWVKHLMSDLGAERYRRIRSEERARMAAHLHDSVLQTLTLIQRNSHDPARMTSLARRQERELRSWLYGDAAGSIGAPGGSGLRAELERIAVEVEELHGVPIEVVVVGDTPLDDAVGELAAAGREAMVNAAKHSGAARIDVFAELRPDRAEVYVRDLGKGFDVDAVAPDRAGLASSIHDRMRRAGGSSIVLSSPGDGTEVELRLPREAGPVDG
jgi:signal transduction histidine kinase